MKNKLKKYLLIIIGVLSVSLGTLGIFLPLLPTTPFLLLAAACFLRSSERLHSWLMNHKWFGTYIRNYLEYRAIPKKSKMVSLLLLWLTIGYSIFLVPIITIKLLLLLIAIGVSWHLMSLNNLEDIDKEKTSNSNSYDFIKYENIKS